MTLESGPIVFKTIDGHVIEGILNSYKKGDEYLNIKKLKPIVTPDAAAVDSYTDQAYFNLNTIIWFSRVMK